MKLRNLFATITKVDAEEGLVYGRLTQEVEDKSGETLDYEKSKPHFEAWSNEASKATEGKSLGNVREMHQLKAVGKLTAIDFDDAEKAIDICAKVVDQDALEKCVEGIYTGFSVGGKLVKRWKDGLITKIIIAPSESSLVDNPCVPTAHFAYIKAAGAAPEERSFKTWEPISADTAKAAEALAATAGTGADWAEYIPEARAQLIKAHADEAVGAEIEDDTDGAVIDPGTRAESYAAAIKAERPDLSDEDIADAQPELEDHFGSAFEAAAKAWAPWDLIATADAIKAAAKKKPKGDYGDVKYADTGYQKDGKSRYPVDTPAHIRSAWNYINKEKNAAAYSSEDLAKVKAAIVAAWKDKIDKDGPPSAQSDKGAPVDSRPEWEQVWRTRDGKNFVKKADAVTHAGALRAGDSPLAAALKAAGASPEGDPPATVPFPRVPGLKAAVEAHKAVRAAFAENVVVKGLYSVGRLAELIESLNWLVVSAGYEAEMEGDASPVPADLAEHLAGLGQCLCDMAREEVAEMIEALQKQGIAVEIVEAGDAVIIELAEGAQVIKAAAVYKAGARNSKTDQERLQAAHDAIAECGADCDAGNLPEPEKKTALADDDAIKAIVAENAALRKQAEDGAASFTKMVEDLRAEVETLKAQPAPMPNLRLVSKEGDLGAGGGAEKTVGEQVLEALGKATPDQLANFAIRASQQNPRALVTPAERDK